jgi:hypothetical protein
MLGARIPEDRKEERKTEVPMTASTEVPTTSGIASASSTGLFSLPSLQAICIHKLLSKEHQLVKDSKKLELPGQLQDKYVEFKQEKLESLLKAILAGEEPETVKKMIEEYPILLLEELTETGCATIQGPSGHKPSLTAYRTALATEDTQMAEMIKAQLIKVADEKEADKQFNAQFPEGYHYDFCSMSAEEMAKDARIKPGKIYIAKLNGSVEYAILGKDHKTVHRSHITADQLGINLNDSKEDKAPFITKLRPAILSKIQKVISKKDHAHPQNWEEEEKAKWAEIFNQLETLTQAIRHAAPGDIISSGDPEYKLTVREGSAVAVALAQFRSLLETTLNEIATTGRHFNPNLLLQAFQIYDDHYEDYFGNNWDNPRAMLFWQQVIGTIQRLMPVNYAQAFCSGLLSTQEKLQKGDAQGRTLAFEVYRSGSGWQAAPFYPLTDSRLGFDYAIYAGHGGTLGRRGVCWLTAVCRAWQGLCQSKTACVQSLRNTKTVEMTHQDRLVL